MDLRDLATRAQGLLVTVGARAAQGVCVNCGQVAAPEGVEEGAAWVCPGCGGEVREAIGGAVLGGLRWLVQRRPGPSTRGGGGRTR